jgi:hypothetical protein
MLTIELKQANYYILGKKSIDSHFPSCHLIDKHETTASKLNDIYIDKDSVR